MIRPSSSASRPDRLANRKASPFSNQSLAHASRVMAPTLVALTFATVAHAQVTMDLSGAQTLMGTFNSRFAYVSVSRASSDAQIYTKNATPLVESLSREVSKASAVDVGNILKPALTPALDKNQKVIPDIGLGIGL